jgi:hypothetical protein
MVLTPTDRWIGRENPETLTNTDHLIYDIGDIAMQREKDDVFSKWSQINWINTFLKNLTTH